MAYNAGNRKDVRELEKQAKLEEQQRREIITGIMSVAPGRKWMYDLLLSCHCFTTCYADLSNRMAFMAGEQSIGIRLLTDIMRACPAEYVTMMGEANARQSAIDARLSKHRPDSDGSDSGQGDDDGEGDYGSDEYDPRSHRQGYDGDPDNG